MKEIRGIVEFHGDEIKVNNGNNEESVVIEKISPYDFEAVIMNQTDGWKMELINDLCQDIGISKVIGKINGLYSKDDMEDCWDSSANYSDEVLRISKGLSTFSVPIRDNKEQYFKNKT